MDLSKRLPEQVKGSKKAWRAALFVNTVGPLAYFSKGRRQSQWTERDIPAMHGKVAIVTGANSGIGYETARALAQRGATVIMACRNLDKAYRAAEDIRALRPSGEVIVMYLDLGDLDLVGQFADNFKANYGQLHLLINNAGIMVPPHGTTRQGFESQFGVNHLGHFALTAQLVDLLNHTPDARVVTVSSAVHRIGKIDFDDLNWQHKSYQAMQAYAQSKLANLLFTYELQRRLSATGHDTIAVAAHPGYTATNLQSKTVMMQLMNRIFAQPQPMGALPTLYAATARDVDGGQYFGPSGLGEVRGNPERVESSAASHNLVHARRLWAVSEELTGTSFAVS
ncbi:MAG: SDR family oxidoreductase [Caldilineaceae bacterium]|nr:SDR family oxidoreductase [Caldilineaceae bacterium]